MVRAVTCFSIAVCVSCVVASTEVETPSLTLQAGLFKSRAAATSLVDQIRTACQSNVELFESDDGYRVLVGKYSDMAELEVSRRELKIAGFSTIPKNLEELKTDGSEDISSLVFPPLENINSVAPSPELRSSMEGQNVAKLMLIPASETRRHPEILRGIEALAVENPLKAELICAYARKRQHATKSAKEVKHLLQSVANGEVSGSASQVVEARRQLARIAHYYEGNSALAYRAYNQVLADAKKLKNSALAAQMNVEIAALCFERVRSNKSPLVADLRSHFEKSIGETVALLESEDLTENTKNAIRRHIARLELMNLEYSPSYLNEEQVIEQAQRFIATNATDESLNGEVAEAFRLIAKMAWSQDNAIACIDACNAAIELTQDKDSIWADSRRNTRFDCLLMKFNALNKFKLGSSQEMNELRTLAQQEFPDHPNLNNFDLPKLPK